MSKSPEVVVERAVGYIKEETDTQLVLRVQLPDRRREDRVFEKQDLPKREEGESPLFEITETAGGVKFRWLAVPPSDFHVGD